MLAIDQLHRISRLDRAVNETQVYVYLAFDQTFSTIKEVADHQSDLNKKVLLRQAQHPEVLWLCRMPRTDWYWVINQWRQGQSLHELLAVEAVK